MLSGHTIDSLGFAPAAAASGLGFASDVTALSWEDGPIARRGAYGDKLVAELEFPGKDVHAADGASGHRSRRCGGVGSAPMRDVCDRARRRRADRARRLPRGAGRRRRYHEGRLPALDRPRGRGEGQHPAFRGSWPRGSARR